MSKAPLSHFLASDWFKNLPPKVQEVARVYPPGLYKLMTTGQTVLLHCYTESLDGTCTTCRIRVTPEYEPRCIMPREVFDIPLKDLRPVDILE